MLNMLECMGRIRLLRGSEGKLQVLKFLRMATHAHGRKETASFRASMVPFDCCALSFQPFENPVCARNSDGTGTVFDLVNIIPWLKCVAIIILPVALL
jgi:hypothetical protein